MRWITLLSPTLLSSTYKWKWKLRGAKTQSHRACKWESQLTPGLLSSWGPSHTGVQPCFFLSLPPRYRNSILSPLSSVYLLFFCDLIKYSHLFPSTQLFCWIFKPVLDFFHLNFWAAHQSPGIKVNIPSPPLETYPAESDGGFSGSKANKIQEVPVKKKNAKC